MFVSIKKGPKILHNDENILVLFGFLISHKLFNLLIKI